MKYQKHGNNSTSQWSSRISVASSTQDKKTELSFLHRVTASHKEKQLSIDDFDDWNSSGSTNILAEILA